MRQFLQLILCGLVLQFLACGYAFQGSGSVLPEDIKTVAIRVSENNTTKPGLGLRFTEKLRSRFERYGVVEVVDEDGDADAELITSIEAITTKVRDVTGSSDIALELDLIMQVRAELRSKQGQILYRNDNLQVSESYGSVSDVVVTSSSSFAQGGISGGTLGSLGDREVSRGQEDQTIETLLDEASRVLYLDAVAADF